MKIEMKHEGEEAFIEIKEAIPHAHGLLVNGKWYAPATKEESEKLEAKWKKAVSPGD